MTRPFFCSLPQAGRMAALVMAMLATSAAVEAQRSPVARVKPLPGDITPQVDPRDCGHFQGHFGPFDFRTAHPHDRRVVEEFHFDMELRTFLSGQTVGRNRAGTGSVSGGFAYTLKSFPNHPSALLVLDQLGRRLKSESPAGIEFPVECWFVRAFMIAPDDPAVRALYGGYLLHRGRTKEAVYNLKLGDDGTHESAALQHQIGLAWVQLKEWQRAQLVALRLKRLRYPLDTVARRVVEAKQWDDALVLPPEPAEVAASSPASAMPASGASSPSSQ